jgi:hypothetical protein
MLHRFIHTQNLKHFHELLAQETDPAKREQIKRLLKEEEDRKSDPLEAAKDQR